MIFMAIRKKILIYIISVLILISIIFAAYIKQNASRSFTHENYEGKAIIIFIDEKKLYLVENNKCLKKYSIASGKPESPSPIGNWKVTEKKDWGEGFGGYWLGLDVLWGNYGIHGTTREDTIGGDASHGCIRMFKRDIKELYKLVEIGTPVIISNGPYGPFGTGFRKLIPGDRGADVLAVQQKLRELGYYSGQEDGIYGDYLQKAIYNFQKDKQLKIKFTITENDYHAMGFKEFE